MPQWRIAFLNRALARDDRSSGNALISAQRGIEHRDWSGAHRLTAAVESMQDAEDDGIAQSNSRGERDNDGNQQEKRR